MSDAGPARGRNRPPRAGASPVLAGHTLAEVIQRRPDLRWPLPERFAERLTGRRVEGLGRRSKWLLMALDGDETWMVHLGMSGRMLIADPGAAAEMIGEFTHEAGQHGKHDHVVGHHRCGRAGHLQSMPARFGAMDLWPTGDLDGHAHLKGLGHWSPWATRFTPMRWRRRWPDGRARSRRCCWTSARWPGLGNIYVCEALYRAGIHPGRIAAGIGRSPDRAAGRRDRCRAGRRHRRRRIEPARLSPGGRGVGLFPAFLPGL